MSVPTDGQPGKRECFVVVFSSHDDVFDNDAMINLPHHTMPSQRQSQQIRADHRVAGHRIIGGNTVASRLEPLEFQLETPPVHRVHSHYNDNQLTTKRQALKGSQNSGIASSKSTACCQRMP